MTCTDDDTRVGHDRPTSNVLHLVPGAADASVPESTGKAAASRGPSRKRRRTAPESKPAARRARSDRESSDQTDSRANVIELTAHRADQKFQRAQKLADECVAAGDDFHTFCEKAELLPPVWDNWEAPTLGDAFCYGFYLNALVERMNAFADDVQVMQRLAALADRVAEDSIEILLPSVRDYYTDLKVRKRFDAFISGQRADSTTWRIMALDFALRLHADACSLNAKASKQMRKLKRLTRRGGGRHAG